MTLLSQMQKDYDKFPVNKLKLILKNLNEIIYNSLDYYQIIL